MGIKASLSIIGLVGFLLIFLVAHFYPSVPDSLMGWIALLLLGLPAWILLESVGDFVLGSSFFKAMPGWLRITVGVPVVLVLMGIAFIVVLVVQNAIRAVGG
jgi:hypothetical protein